ncbi:MAG: hypothetical protein JXQ76_10065 [Campylobacterales bacterium]|nr:hypothetical protein [Campylobacterales bacterium]
MMRYIASLFIVYFFLACGSSDSPRLTVDETATTNDKTLGTWILSTSGFDNTNATQGSANYILGNLANRNIKHIDQLVSFELLGDNSYRIAYEEGLMEFITKAVSEGIRVNLLINDKELFNKDNYEDSMKKVETIIDFNNRLVSTNGTRILGIKFRVDLERSTGWIQSHSEAIYNSLYFLFQAKAKIAREGAGMLVSVDVDDSWESGSYSISFNYKDKTFTQHILDTVDYITVLSFGREVGEVMSKIEEELLYCRDEQLTNRIVPALAVSPIVNLSDSFYGLQDSTLFWSTLYALQREVEGDLRIPMIMIENFEYFDQIPPIPAN